MTSEEADEAYRDVEERIKDRRPALYVSKRETVKGDYYLVIRKLGVPVSALQPEEEVPHDDSNVGM